MRDKADQIMREFRNDPTGSKCKCKGNHPGSNPPCPFTPPGCTLVLVYVYNCLTDIELFYQHLPPLSI